MDYLPEVEQLRGIDWQIFATLTFKGSAPAQSEHRDMLFAWLRYFSKAGRRHFEKLLWCTRYEVKPGDVHPHYHAVIGGLHSLTIDTLRTADAVWKRHGGGFTRIEQYDPSRDGVGYMLKQPPQYGRSHRLRDDETYIPTLSDGLRALLRRRHR